jgi:ribosome-binding factor A
MSKRRRFNRSQSVPPETGEFASEGADLRQVRLEHVLFDELQALIRDEASDPALEGVRLISVQLSPDGGHARIPYAVVAPLSSETERGRASAAGLVRASAFLRARLAQQLDLKRLPKLSFVFVGATEEGGEPCPEW